MNIPQTGPNDNTDQTRKRRAACDQCHAAKVKCPGREDPCQRCAQAALPCHYSFTARMGKPPGSRNKRTREGLRANSGVHLHHDSIQSLHEAEMSNERAQREEPGTMASPRVRTDFSLLDVEDLMRSDPLEESYSPSFDILADLDQASARSPFDYSFTTSDNTGSVSGPVGFCSNLPTI